MRRRGRRLSASLVGGALALGLLACGAGCESGERGTLPVGAACERAGECQGGACLSSSDPRLFVGGYCTSGCDPAADECGPDAACYPLPGYEPVCMRTCAAATDCREPGYVCVGVCLPEPTTTPLVRPGTLVGTEPAIADRIAAVDDERVMRRVRVLAGEEPWDGPGGAVTLRSRALGHPDHDLVAAYLEAELVAAGLEVRRLETTLDGTTYINLEAAIAGTDPAAEPVYLLAHWDSTASAEPGWKAGVTPAPGAGDNASGTAIALEVGTILAAPEAARPRRPTRLVLFDGEEVGLYGSTLYVEELTRTGARVACALDVDMVHATMPATAGRLWYLFPAAAPFWAGLGAEAAERFVSEVPLIPSDDDRMASDHRPFWDAGFCAVALIAYPRLPSNHGSDDTTATFQPAYFAAVTRAAVAIAAAWSDGDPDAASALLR